MARVLVVLVLVLLAAPLALAASPRSETRTYVGPTHDTSARVVACNAAAQPAPFAVDGACFRLDGSERAVDVRVADASGLPILAHVFFRGADGITLSGGFVCVSDSSWSAPPGAATLNVWLLPDPGVNTPGDCPLVHGQATVGTVTATFS